MSREFKTKDSPETLARRKANAAFSKMMFRGQSNVDFSKTDVAFQTACSNAGVEATTRQASKYRNKTGAAYNSKGAK